MAKIANILKITIELFRLIIFTAKRDIYSKLFQKHITSWAHIRNKSAHGEYGETQVEKMLLFVQGFSEQYLS
jgi:hypothetical protein